MLPCTLELPTNTLSNIPSSWFLCVRFSVLPAHTRFCYRYLYAHYAHYMLPTCHVVHHFTYSLHEGTTIGYLTNMIVQLKMHHFLFLPYTSQGRWKGCRDHVNVLSFCFGG